MCRVIEVLMEMIYINYAHKSPKDLTEIHILTPQVWRGAWEFEFFSGGADMMLALRA